MNNIGWFWYVDESTCEVLPPWQDLFQRGTSHNRSLLSQNSSCCSWRQNVKPQWLQLYLCKTCHRPSYSRKQRSRHSLRCSRPLSSSSPFSCWTSSSSSSTRAGLLYSPHHQLVGDHQDPADQSGPWEVGYHCMWVGIIHCVSIPSCPGKGHGI